MILILEDSHPTLQLTDNPHFQRVLTVPQSHKESAELFGRRGGAISDGKQRLQCTAADVKPKEENGRKIQNLEMMPDFFSDTKKNAL